MRELIVVEYLSLDGVMQAPGYATEDTDGGFRYGGWTGPFMTDHRRYMSQLFQTVGAFLFGRRTYELFADVWPTMTEQDDLIARALNESPKYVVSSTLTEARWQPATIIKGTIPEAVDTLKQEPGSPIAVVGSSTLAHALTRHGLVDQYCLMLHPVILGTGKRLFTEDTPMAGLRLIDCTTATSGLVMLTYQR
jgi:dihydrofolate reductase